MAEAEARHSAAVDAFAVVTWALSVPLGALLSWLLIHDLNVVSFGWTMPMLWSPMPALRLLVLVAGLLVLVLALVTGLMRKRLPEAMAQVGSGA